MRKRMILLNNIIIIVLFFFCQCSVAQNEINFNYDAFIQEMSNDSVDTCIKNLRKGFFSDKGFCNDLNTIDVGPLYTDDVGGKYLGSLDEYVINYASNSDSLLVLSVFLKEKYNLKNSIYDQLLRQCIVLDKEYNRAIYLLAELRYKKGGYAEDAYFLISLLKNRLSTNQEVFRVYKYFKNKLGGDPVRPDDFEKYLYQDYYYIIE